MTKFFAGHWRIIALVLGLAVILWVLYVLRTVVLPFATGLVLAYLLMPVVLWVEKKLPPRGKWPGFKRVFSVLLIFLLIICLIGGFAYFIVSTVVSASVTLVEHTPFFLAQSLYQIQQWLEHLRQQLPDQIREQVDKALVEGGASAGGYIRGALMGSIAALPRTFTSILGFAVLPFFLFYIMKDLERLKKGMASMLSPGAARHARNIINIVEEVMGRYIRAQIMLGIIVGYFTFIGLLILNIPFALALAALAGVMEMIPTLGPWIGAAVAVIVTLAMAPEQVLWVVVLFGVIQLLENTLLVPKVQSAYLRIHPAIMIALLVFGAYLAGFWGLVLAGPLTATLVQIVKYVRHHYRSETSLQA